VSTLKKIRILGVDPGSRLTGYGIVDLVQNGVDGRQHTFELIEHGALQLASTSGKATIPLEIRLLNIFHGLSEVIQEYQPEILSIERVFFANNAVSALKLGQARGAAILTSVLKGLSVVEYSPTEVKSAIVGHGRADKDQMAKMISILLKANTADFVTSDASDAVGLALCHAQALSQSLRGGKIAATTTLIGKSQRKSGKSLADSLGLTADMVEGKRSLNVKDRNKNGKST
jgi:crossover junction endodeoxyribonuclease RuvC